MSALTELRKYREKRFFESWDTFVEAALVTAAEASIRKMVDDLIALGAKPTEAAARRVVTRCVKRFNKMDDGWICTIEREDIGDHIHHLVKLRGFECDDDWLADADW